MKFTTSSLPCLRIVIVDSNPAFLAFLKDVLQRDLGHEVVGEANNGTNMVRTVLNLEPDMVVFNVHLPHLNGIEAIRQIQTSLHVAAVAVASETGESFLRQALEAHVEAYLTEPIDPRHLGPALQIAWARSEERRQLQEENAKMRQALKNRKIVERAKGVLMKRYRWSEDHAFRNLQRTAMNQRKPLVDLAQAILNGQTIDFNAGEPAPELLVGASH